MPALTSRVALLSYDDVPPIGGQGRYAGALEREMPKAGFEMEMLSARRGPWGTGVRIPKRTRRAPWTSRSGCADDCPKWRRLWLPTCGTRWEARAGCCSFGIPRGRRWSTPPTTPTEPHTGRRLATRPLGGMEARAYRFSEHVIAVSASTASSLAEDYDVPSQKITVIPVGIETEWLQPVDDKEERDTILFVGRLVPIKGVQHFVAIFRDLIKEFPDLRAEVCGEGPLYNAVVGAAKEFEGRLLVMGKVSESDLASAYRRARLLVVPSRYEGLGVGRSRGHGGGNPGASHRRSRPPRPQGGRGGTGRAGRHGRPAQGSPGHPGRPARWDEMSAAARQAVVEHYSWDAVRPQIAEVYRSVLGSRASQVA